MADNKQTFDQFLVFYFSDDGTELFALPKDVANTDESKMVINAIAGRDEQYNPYTGTGDNLNKEYIKSIESILQIWRIKYLLPNNTIGTNFAFGNGYQ